MDLSAFDVFCRKLPHTTHVVQWGGASVWKIGAKVFAIGWSNPFGVTFKAGDIGYEILREEEGFMPAPYFAKRGMKWILAEEVVETSELQNHIKNSYNIVFSGLSKKMQASLKD